MRIMQGDKVASPRSRIHSQRSGHIYEVRRMEV
jgi:hypothetical protein